MDTLNDGGSVSITIRVPAQLANRIDDYRSASPSRFPPSRSEVIRAILDRELDREAAHGRKRIRPVN